MTFQEMFELTGINQKAMKEKVEKFFSTPESFIFDYRQLENQLTQSQIKKIKSLSSVIGNKNYKAIVREKVNNSYNVVGSVLLEYPELLHLETEKFVVLVTDRHLDVIDKIEFSIHDNGSVPITISHIVRRVLMNEKAAAIFTAHNHPSGCVTPSMDDERTNRQLLEAVNIFGIQNPDNIIIGKQGNQVCFYSCRECREEKIQL